MSTKRVPHPLNAPGPFYVEAGMCIICCIPAGEAPDLIGFHEGPSENYGRSHCYFRKQPQTSEEIEQAISAVRLACCGAYHYGGNDPSIIRRLLEAGVHPDQIDVLTNPDQNG